MPVSTDLLVYIPHLGFRLYFLDLNTNAVRIRQEGIRLWTGIKGNGSIHDGYGIIGHGLTMDIAKGLSTHEHTCYASIAHLDPKASEQEEGKSL